MQETLLPALLLTSLDQMFDFTTANSTSSGQVVLVGLRTSHAFCCVIILSPSTCFFVFLFFYFWYDQIMCTRPTAFFPTCNDIGSPTNSSGHRYMAAALLCPALHMHVRHRTSFAKLHPQHIVRTTTYSSMSSLIGLHNFFIKPTNQPTNQRLELPNTLTESYESQQVRCLSAPLQTPSAAYLGNVSR